MTSSTSERQIRARVQQAKRDAILEETVIRSLMSHPDGRRWVWLQLEWAQMFVGDENVEPYTMAFQKGRRNTGLKLLKAVQAYTPNDYITMTTEATKVELSLNKEPTNGGRDSDPSDDAYDTHPAHFTDS